MKRASAGIVVVEKEEEEEEGRRADCDPVGTVPLLLLYGVNRSGNNASNTLD